MIGELTLVAGSIVRALAWTVVAAVSFALSMALALRVFTWFSPELQHWDELEAGNLGVALIFGALMLALSLLLYKVL